MATQGEAEQALIDRIVELAPRAGSTQVLNLAEALGWLIAPSNPHGGRSAD